MTTTVQHIHNKLGINLLQEAQSASSLLPDQRSNNNNDIHVSNTHSYLEAIYDVVVGVNEAEGCSFDVGSGRAFDRSRFGCTELSKLIEKVNEMSRRPDTKPGEQEVLRNIKIAAFSYHTFLLGAVNKLPKSPSDLGNRHSLMRGVGGRVFEMTNSMTANEKKLFKSKTGKLLAAVENPKDHYKQNGKQFDKVVLGSGGFGTARIARDIEWDEYVAVKKAHPSLQPSQLHGLVSSPAYKSNFFTGKIDDDDRAQLCKVNDSVIVPIDAQEAGSKKSARTNNTANKFNAMYSTGNHQAGQADTDHFNFNAEAVNAALEKVKDDPIFITLFQNKSFIKKVNNEETFYTFSELGVTTIEGLIERFNVARVYFEGKKKTSALSNEVKEMLIRYSTEFDASSGENRQSIYKDDEKESLARFSSSSFHIKDPTYNQKFLNTLAKKMISALADLHKAKIVHSDIKPDNIVITQDEQGMIDVKLIDIDLIKKASNVPAPPDGGFPTYMPPDLIDKADGSTAFLGENADAYAMGATLRKLVGFNTKEISIVTTTHKLPRALTLVNSYLKTATGEDRTRLLEEKVSILQKIKAYKPTKENRNKRQILVGATMHASPNAVSLKDISDLLLKEHPKKRLTPERLLKLDLNFFKNDALLSDAEFSAYVKQIHRFGIITKDAEVSKVNDASPKATATLIKMRDQSRKAVVRERCGSLAISSKSGKSFVESIKVGIKEWEFQSDARERRRERKALGLDFDNIAEKYLAYPDRS